MTLPSQSDQGNLLLLRMDASDFDRLAPHLDPFKAERGRILFQAGEPNDKAFFLSRGMGSLVAQSPEGLRVEAGLFGREGFGPVGLVMGDDRSPYQGSVQMEDDGFAIATAPLLAALEASGSLRLMLHKYALTLSVQATFTALSNAVHPVEERLARWLLMSDDRSDTGELRLTHEFMSIMLAVRRPSVTTALHVLEGNGLIRAERGLITIRNRRAMEDFAGDAYGTPEREYERLLGPFR